MKRSPSPTFVSWLAQPHRDWLDTYGRPLGEQASPLYPASTVEVVCPWSGSRRGRPMNESARLQVVAHRDEGLATFVGALPSNPVGADLLRVASAVTLAPYVHPLPTPGPVSAAYKTNLGFQQVLISLLLDTPAGVTPTRELPDAAALLIALDDGRWLIGQRQVCAGSPAEIALAWETMCGRRPPPVAPAFVLPGLDWPVAAAALVVALLLVTGERLAAGDRSGLVGFGESPRYDEWPLGARLWHRPQASWMVAATARSGREAAQVRGLFAGPAPAAVERFLASAARRKGHASIEAAFWEAAAELPGDVPAR